MKKFSKGMRIHRRREKAKKRKMESINLQGATRGSLSPKITRVKTKRSFASLPLIIKAPTSAWCPICQTVPYVKDLVWIEFPEGIKQVYLCHNCNILYRY